MQLVQAKCPGCRQILRIPVEWSNGLLRCKQCGEILRSTASVSSSIDGVPTVSDNVAEESASYVMDLRRRRLRRQKQRLAIGGSILALLVFILSVAGYGWRDSLADFFTRASASLGPRPSSVDSSDSSPAQVAASDVVTARSGKKSPTKQSSQPAGPYPRRALLIGVKNYLYASPLNPGYKAVAALGDPDPLGLDSLRQALPALLNFPANQIAELSDTARERPTAPTKAALQDTLTHFLKSSRAQDRLLIVFVGHVAERDGKGYLAPMEAEVERTETLIPLGWLYEQLAACPARQKLLLLDVAHNDPEQGMIRGAVGPLGARVEAELKKPPDGVQVCLSCSAGQYSYEFGNSGLTGSVFMHFLVKNIEELKRPDTRKDLERRLGLAEGSWRDGPVETLPLVRLLPEVHRETTNYVGNDRFNAAQTPLHFGNEKATADSSPDMSAPAPVTLRVPEFSEKADSQLIAAIVAEMDLAEADFAKTVGLYLAQTQSGQRLEPYRADASSDSSIRKTVVETTRLLRENERAFPLSFRFPGDDAAFKKRLNDQQEGAAEVEAILNEGLTKLESMASERDKEPSRRWQAHHDYVYARLLAKLASVQEWNDVLGEMKRDTPPLTRKESTGWNLVSQDKMHQSESRKMERERQKKRQEVLVKLIKEHPGTPWEILAKSESKRQLGLKPQEAKVD